MSGLSRASEPEKYCIRVRHDLLLFRDAEWLNDVGTSFAHVVFARP